MGKTNYSKRDHLWTRS